MSNETNTAPKDEETIEGSILDNVLRFIFGEEATKISGMQYFLIGRKGEK